MKFADMTYAQQDLFKRKVAAVVMAGAYLTLGAYIGAGEMGNKTVLAIGDHIAKEEQRFGEWSGLYSPADRACDLARDQFRKTEKAVTVSVAPIRADQPTVTCSITSKAPAHS